MFALKTGLRKFIVILILILGYMSMVTQRFWLGIKNRLPLMSEGNDYVEAGALVSYSANEAESFRRAAVYVDQASRFDRRATDEFRVQL